MSITIYTWGYQGRTAQTLLEIVEREGVDLVVDVRGNPYSRRPQWRKEGLEDTLGDIYRWIGWLGNENYQEATAPVLRDPDRGMDELALEIDGGASRLLLLCYERDWRECHRQMVVDLAKERFPDVQVKHL